MSKDNGGHAFPNIKMSSMGLIDDKGDGMSLRDYFAAKALQGFLSNHAFFTDARQVPDGFSFTKEAYKYADAMLEARK